MTIDYRALLVRYMAVVIDAESVDYIEHHPGYVVKLTEEEKSQLEVISQEARKEYGL